MKAGTPNSLRDAIRNGIRAARAPLRGSNARLSDNTLADIVAEHVVDFLAQRAGAMMLARPANEKAYRDLWQAINHHDSAELAKILKTFR